MRNVVAAIIMFFVIYGIYVLIGLAAVKPAFEKFHNGIQEFNHEIQGFDESQ